MKKILIIDDEVTILKLLQHYLSDYYEVVVMPDGLQAFSWMQEGNIPDMIVADIQMPVLNGYDFLSQIKASGFFKDTPVIMLSSIDNSTEKIKCLRMGARDYVIKPFNPEELYLRIKNTIEN
jgi:DNA-binding response OmpR family regulator